MSDLKPASLAPTTLLQIIVGSLILSVLIFAGYVIFRRQSLPQFEFGASPLDYVVVILVPVQLLVSHLLPRQMMAARAQALATTTEDEAAVRQQLLVAYQGSTIIGGALAEAACFLTLVVLFMGAPDVFWGLFAAGLIVLVAKLPGSRTLEEQMQRWLGVIREQQQFGQPSLTELRS